MKKSQKKKPTTQFKLQIHGTTWDVFLVSRSNPLMEGALGICFQNQLTIYVSEELPDELFSSTLFHECVHACMAIYAQVNENDRNEEHYADAVGIGMSQVIPQLQKLPEDIKKRLKI